MVKLCQSINMNRPKVRVGSRPSRPVVLDHTQGSSRVPIPDASANRSGVLFGSEAALMSCHWPVWPSSVSPAHRAPQYRQPPKGSRSIRRRQYGRPYNGHCPSCLGVVFPSWACPCSVIEARKVSQHAYVCRIVHMPLVFHLHAVQRC